MSFIAISARDYDVTVFRAQSYSSIKNHDGKIFKYKFSVGGAHIVSQKKYANRRTAYNAGVRLLTDILRSKIKNKADLGMIAAESEFIQEYFKLMGECEPSKLFKNHNKLLKKCIDAYISQVDMSCF